MAISRRLFLTEAAAAGCLPAFLSEAMRAEQASTQNSGKPTVGENYWSNLYKNNDQRGRQSVFGDELRDPRFAFFVEQKGFRWAEDNKPEDLPSFDEDAVVTLELGGFRAGRLDQPKLRSVRFAQMHLSCQQVKGTDFIGPLAWASLATVFADKANKLPSVQDLSSVPATSARTMPGAPQLNRVLLPQGAGHLSVNVTTTPTSSILDKILSTTLKVTKILTPLFGFPAISLPALNAFSIFYGQLERATANNFLINTSLKDVAVTQKGTTDPNVSVKAVNLVSGYYILVPKSQEQLLADEMDNLTVQNGYLILRKDSGSNTTSDDRVNNAVPNLTYVTLHADVKPASAFTSNSGKSENSGDSAPANRDTNSGKKKGTTSKKAKPE